MKPLDTAISLKSIEVQGFKVELLSENQGATFRVNVKDEGGYRRTRVFVNYSEANALFSSYQQGN